MADAGLSEMRFPMGLRRKYVLCFGCFVVTFCLVVYVFRPSSSHDSNMSDLFAKESLHSAVANQRTLVASVRAIYDYSYLISPDALCNSSSVRSAPMAVVAVVAVVATAPKNFEARRVIRLTWGSVAGTNNSSVRLAFMIGRSDADTEKKIREEHAAHGDVILADFQDSYRNLSLKSLAILHWVSHHCSSAKNLLKVDDDMFINVPNLLKTLQSIKVKNFVLGNRIHGAVPIQNPKSKWYTPKNLFPVKVYPDYVSGTAYVISGDLVSSLSEVALHTEIFWLEDIFVTGICAKRLGAKLIGNNAFTFRKRPLTACAYRGAISGHENTPEDIMTIWNDMRSGRKC